MLLHWKPQKNQRQGFTLGEVLVAFCVFGMVISGLMYGYVQTNRMAEMSSMSLAAQSFAIQGLEEANRCNGITCAGPTRMRTGGPLLDPATVGYTNLPARKWMSWTCRRRGDSDLRDQFRDGYRNRFAPI